jgi:hypothetical protein
LCGHEGEVKMMKMKEGEVKMKEGEVKMKEGEVKMIKEGEMYGVLYYLLYYGFYNVLIISIFLYNNYL